MLSFNDSYFCGETRDGFYIEPMMKRAWAASLEVMHVVQQICEKHNICYYADWGTLLGAVRHQGFIPWDDDIDICMLRSDYQRFLEIAPSELKGEYHIANLYTYENFCDNFSRIVNSNRIAHTPERLKEFHGCPYIVGIDIFPLDELPMAPTEEQAQNQLIFILDSAARNCADNMEEVILLLPELEKLCGVTFDQYRNIADQLFRTIDNLCQLYNSTGSSLLSFVPHNALKGFHLQREWYDSCLYLPFENITLPVPSDYDKVLTEMYGDYMTPCQEKASHDYPFYKKQLEDMAKKGS